MMILNKKSQSTLEFTFGVIAIMFLVYGIVQVFRWAGMDLANRRYYMDHALTNKVTTEQQLDYNDEVILPMDAVYHGKITNGNETP